MLSLSIGMSCWYIYNLREGNVAVDFLANIGSNSVNKWILYHQPPYSFDQIFLAEMLWGCKFVGFSLLVLFFPFSCFFLSLYKKINIFHIIESIYVGVFLLKHLFWTYILKRIKILNLHLEQENVKILKIRKL